MPRRGRCLPPCLPPFICLLILSSLKHLPWLPVTPRIVSLGLDLGPPGLSSSHLPALSLHASCFLTRLPSLPWLLLGLRPRCPLPASTAADPTGPPGPAAWPPASGSVPGSPASASLDPAALYPTTFFLPQGNGLWLALSPPSRGGPRGHGLGLSLFTLWPSLGLALMGSCLAFQFIHYFPARHGLSDSLSTFREGAGREFANPRSTAGETEAQEGSISCPGAHVEIRKPGQTRAPHSRL